MSSKIDVQGAIYGADRTGVIWEVTMQTLDAFTPDQLKDSHFVRTIVLDRCNEELDLRNAIRPTGKKFKLLTELDPAQVASILIRKYPIALVNVSDDCTPGHSGLGQTTAYYDIPKNAERAILCIYQTDGPMKGIYVESEGQFDYIIHDLAYDYPVRKYADVIRNLRMIAPVVDLCRDPDLIAVNNGVFNYQTKDLLEFSPDMVFLAKSFVDYKDVVMNPVIHNVDDGTDWDFDSWIRELVADDDTATLLWQILGAVIRPNVRWNKSAWFYSEQGNNGKGTFCELCRQLCGVYSCVTLPLADMGIDFKLEPLMHATAIITDENDVGTFIDKAANLKAIITGDAILINRKFKLPITYSFRGFMIQCLNEMPKIRDKSDSFFRRQIFVAFDKCFTGQERKYIKEDYLHRPEVLEYVLHTVLHMNYATLEPTKACDEALESYRLFADPVYSFLYEVLDLLAWDLVPWYFLYDLYCAWYKRNNQGSVSGIIGSRTFFKEVRMKLPKISDAWEITDARYKPANRMAVPEPLIHEYELQKWMNPIYQNDKDPLRKCNPILAATYTGLLRKTTGIGSTKTGTDRD